MADNKSGRDKQADDAERRQRKRELEEARDRDDEPEPVDDTGQQLGDLDGVLETQDYPATTSDLVAAFGDRDLQTQDGSASLADILGSLDEETYRSPEDARERIQGLIGR